MSAKKPQTQSVDNIDSFKELKEKVLSIDPVRWAENNLKLENNSFSLHNGGWKPLADIYRCIGVKSLEKNAKPVVVVSGRQVGKTTMASILECWFVGSGVFGGTNNPARVLHAFPTLDMAAGYAKTKLQAIINESKFSGVVKNGKAKSILQMQIDTSQESNNSLQFKQFLHGNQLFIESTGKEGDRIRGKTVDILFFDEVQDMLQEAINNTNKILTASKYGPVGQGVQVFLGTPKKKGSLYHNLWLKSNQQYYHLGCGKCKELFPLYTPDSDDWEKIWITEFTVECPHCGEQQNKHDAAERGKWVPTITDESAYSLIGFHINQLFIPTFTKEAVLRQKPNQNPSATDRSYQNEVLGEFYHGENSPLDIQQIVDACGDKHRSFSKSISPTSNKTVVMGVDFGLKNDMEQLADKTTSKNVGSSFTTAVIMTIENNQLFNVEFACMFKKNDFNYKMDFIAKLMQDYSVSLCVGDIGFSQDISEKLYEVHNNKYMVSRAAGKLTNNINVLDTYPKEIQFNKTYYYSDMINKLKTGNVRFPIKSYDSISWLIQHCTNIELKVSMSRSNEPTAMYVKSGINDGFAALLNAYIAAKYILTDGFIEHDPTKLNGKSGGKSKSSVVLAHIPNMR